MPPMMKSSAAANGASGTGDGETQPILIVPSPPPPPVIPPPRGASGSWSPGVRRRRAVVPGAEPARRGRPGVAVVAGRRRRPCAQAARIAAVDPAVPAIAEQPASTDRLVRSTGRRSSWLLPLCRVLGRSGRSPANARSSRASRSAALTRTRVVRDLDGGPLGGLGEVVARRGRARRGTSGRGSRRRGPTARRRRRRRGASRAPASRAISSGRAGALKATAWGSSTQWVSAWTRLNVPPRTWLILWCKPADVRTERHARQVGAVEQLGTARRGRRAGPSRAAASDGWPARPPAPRHVVTGLCPGTYSASTLWARALNDDGPVTARRQADGQLGVVDHGLRQHDRVLAGLLVAPAGEPVDRGLLAAGVRRRHGDDRQALGQGDRLRQTGRRAAADADEHVGARRRRRTHGPARPARRGRAATTSPQRATDVGRRGTRPARRPSPSPRRRR